MPEKLMIDIGVSAAYTDGTILLDDVQFLANTTLEEIKTRTGRVHSHYDTICIRLIMPKESSEKFLDGMRSGKVSLYVEQMKYGLEQAA